MDSSICPPCTRDTHIVCYHGRQGLFYLLLHGDNRGVPLAARRGLPLPPVIAGAIVFDSERYSAFSYGGSRSGELLLKVNAQKPLSPLLRSAIALTNANSFCASTLCVSPPSSRTSSRISAAPALSPIL